MEPNHQKRAIDYQKPWLGKRANAIKEPNTYMRALLSKNTAERERTHEEEGSRRPVGHGYYAKRSL